MKALIALIALAALPAAAANHPNLLFSASDLPAIRARLAGPEKDLGDALRAGVKSAFDGSGFPATPDLGYSAFDPIAVADTTLAFAFASAVWADQAADPIAAQAKQLGHDYLMGVCRFSDWQFESFQGYAGPDVTLGHYLFAVALAYDWLYPTLTPEERQTCQARVAIEGAKMNRGARMPRTDSSPWWIEQYLQNHHWVSNAALGMAALGFRGELANADTDEWLSTASIAMGKVHTALNLAPGGAWHEGNGYLNYGLDAIVPFSVAKTRVAGGPSFADNLLIQDYPRLRMYGMPPAKAHRREYPVWGDFSGFQDHNMLLSMRYVAKTRRDGQAAWAADQYCDGKAIGVAAYPSWPPAQRGLLLSLLLADDTVPKTPPPSEGAWALDYHATDLGVVLGRSGWEDGGALLAFKSGVFGGRGNFERMKARGEPGGLLNVSHDHADDMSVFFFADSEWQTSNVPGYFIGRDNGTPQANKTRYANSLLVDGAGQLGEGVRAEDYSRLPWFFERESSIPFCGSTTHNAFTMAIGHKLYPSSMGLTRFERSVLFVDRAFPIVRDVVRSSSARKFEITYHAMDSVSQDGQWLKLAGKNDRVLGVRVVSPASFALATESQTAVHLDKFEPDGQMTAAFVRPASNTNAVTFLTALVPARGSSWASRPKVDPVDPASPDRGVTLTGFSGAQRIDVVFNDEADATSSAAGLTVTGMAGVKKSDGSKVLRATLASGTKLVIDGKPWVEVLQPAPATFEVEQTAAGLDISGDAVPARFYAPSASTVRLNGAAVTFERDGEFILISKSAAAAATSNTRAAAAAAGEEACDPATAAGGAGAGFGPGEGEGAGCASAGGGTWVLAGLLALIPFGLRRRARQRARVS